MQGVVVQNSGGSGVSHPFREALGCLSLVILFVTFVVPLRGLEALIQSTDIVTHTLAFPVVVR